MAVMDIIKEILEKDEQNKNIAAESTSVSKLIPPECFPRDLMVFDTNELNIPKLRGPDKEKELLSLTRDCTQILINTILSFPKEIKDGKVFVQLSGPSYNLPREKPVPVPKPLTKWQKFAQDKGLRKKKKPKSTWDDVLQKWIPTYGYRKAAAEKEKNWVLEVPQNVHPNTDMFAEKTKTKKENIAKNEYQRLRNVAASRKIKVPKVGIPPMETNLHVSQLKDAANIARISTASIGKFQPKLPEEKHLKQRKPLNRQKKRPLLNTDEEKQFNMNIAEGIVKKKPKLNISKAVNKQIYEEQSQRNKEKQEKKGKKRKNFTNNKFHSKKKPKGQQGRVGKKKNTGRKRR
ncbi:hypothetical protein PGB90_006967 [Kerria lacca]